MTDFTLEPGSVNYAFEPRFWVMEPLEAEGVLTAEFGRMSVDQLFSYLNKFTHPPMIFELRFVLPILGCGNDP